MKQVAADYHNISRTSNCGVKQSEGIIKIAAVELTQKCPPIW